MENQLKLLESQVMGCLRKLHETLNTFGHNLFTPEALKGSNLSVSSDPKGRQVIVTSLEWVEGTQICLEVNERNEIISGEAIIKFENSEINTYDFSIDPNGDIIVDLEHEEMGNFTARIL